ncbi:Protein NLRC3 [Linum perenne]
MSSSSTLSLCSHPQVIIFVYFLHLISFLRRQELLQISRPPSSSLCYRAQGALLLPFSSDSTLLGFRRRRCFRFKSLVVNAATSTSGRSRRVYKQSEGESFFGGGAPVQQIASFALPAGAVLIASFALWKLAEKVFKPKPSSPSVEGRVAEEGMKWPFGGGSNFLSKITSNEAKGTLNAFSYELVRYESVDMTGFNFGDEGIFYLAGSLAYNKILEEVSFASNGITAEGINAFKGVLETNVHLKTLNLSGNAIGDEGTKRLCEYMVKNTGIEKLQLNSADVGDEGGQAIADLLKKNSTLRVIELNNNMIDYSGFTSLAGALTENNTVQSLYLNGNYGGTLGVNALAKGIEGNKALQELHLQGNSIGDEGARALISGLSSSKAKLTHLDLGNNSISLTGAVHVAEYIKKSKSLFWINLYMNDLGDEVKKSPIECAFLCL